jgi:gluconolactonase
MLPMIRERSAALVARFAVCLLFPALLLHAQTPAHPQAAAHTPEYPLGADSQPHADVPKGTVTKYELPAGRFYPGTPHTYWVYVPAQYEAAKPAPFMIFLDGGSFLSNGVRVPVVLDNLIARHEVPPMIAIFVDPGVLPAVSPQDQNRYERVFEYDSLSDRFASFLVDELIPAVGKQYRLSSDPNDRALSGLSTGAVGAFMAAWNRPDQFHRVLSFIGTYVAMKGADALPALIRKTEPKPLRIFLQDGRNDHMAPAEPWGTFYAGSWPINNQVMYQALEYAGYDAKFELGDGGHNMNQGASILPDALRWLWRDYPAPIVAHAPAAMQQPGWDPRGKVESMVDLDSPWQAVGSGLQSVSGLAAGRDGAVFVSDSIANRIYRVSEDGKLQLFRENTHGATALREGADGRLYAVEPGLRRIVSYDATYHTKSAEKVVARDVDATDLAVTTKGAIYFTDAAHTVNLIEPGGGVRVVYPAGGLASGIADAGDGLASPDGLTLSPDQSLLIVADAQSRYSWSFQIAPDGSLENGEPYFRLEMPEESWRSGVRSVAEDSDGQVYFATPLGVQGCEANGRLAQILNPPVTPGGVTGLLFAGEDWKWMYVAEGKQLFRRRVKVTGANPWIAIKPPKPAL